VAKKVFGADCLVGVYQKQVIFAYIKNVSQICRKQVSKFQIVDEHSGLSNNQCKQIFRMIMLEMKRAPTFTPTSWCLK